MLNVGVIFPGKGTDAAVLGVLLTVESLLLTVSGLLLTVGSGQPGSVSPRTVGRLTALLVLFVGFATVLLWISVFDSPMVKAWQGVAIAIVLLAAIVFEPLFALVVAFPLSRKPRRPPA